MATKYIVDNLSAQTITGDLIISGKTSIVTTPPTSLTGTTGDTQGQIVFDGDYMYYCADNFSEPTPIVISGGGTTHVFDAEPSTEWNGYGDVYLQTGPPQEEGLTPLAGWYIVDDNGTIRQVLSTPAWFTGGNPTPFPNGSGWFFVLDGPFVYNVSNPTITFYETLPTVTGGVGSGNIWRTVKLDKTLNTTGIYRALLTQTNTIIGTNLSNFDGALIIGETYTINNYNTDDDFSNVADVQSGTINQSGCQFIATGETPNLWANGSEIQSSGNLVVTVLENSLGYDLSWQLAPFGGYGYYVAINGKTGPMLNSFPRNKVFIMCQVKEPLGWEEFATLLLRAKPNSIENKDDSIRIDVIDWVAKDNTDDALYYTPVEIRVITDPTPVQILGTIQPSYPFNNLSMYIKCNGNTVWTIYTNYDNITDITVLVNELNTKTDFNILGVFSSDGEGGLILNTTNTIKEQFCQSGTMTFEIFND